MTVTRDHTKETKSYPYIRGFMRPRGEKVDNTITIPDTPEGFAEALMDDEIVAKIMLPENKDVRKEFFTSYARSMNKGEYLSEQVSDQVTNVMMDWLKDNGLAEGRPDMSELAGELAKKLNPETRGGGGGRASTVYNPKAMGAAIDGEFEDSSDYFRTIWHNTHRSGEVAKKIETVRNAFSENVPSEGGFLVPERLRSELLRVALETSIVRSRARVIPMDSLRVPFPKIDSTSNVSSVFGGIVAYWTEEGATLTESQAKFARLVLEAKKLTAYTEVPNELVSDSAISFGAFIDDIFPEALAFYEDVAFFSGLGVGEPLGFLNAPAAISVDKRSGQAASTIVWENLVDMFSRMLPSSLGRSVWIASIDTFPELATMALSVGTGGSAVWLNNGREGPPATILGRPVIFTEKATALGGAGDINLVDLGFYLIGDRQVMSARSSEHHKFQDDMTAYRIIERLDGRPWVDSEITPKNSSATLSPFVKIEART